MRRAALSVLLVLAAGCAGGPAPTKLPTPAPGKAPFSAPPAANHEIRIALDTRAAREILASLSRPRYEATDIKILEDMLPIELAIRDSGRSEEVFQRDFRAAFDPETKTAVFDFATIRREKDRWAVLLDAVSSRKEEIESACARRAASLLPGDRPISVKLDAFVTFGLAGLADHMIVTTPDGAPAIIIDLARVLGETGSDSDPVKSEVSRLERLVSGEAYRLAWAAYRGQSAGWKRPLTALGALEPLVRITAEAGPVAVFGIDDSFFPLSTWLKEPMQRAMNELNRMSERLVESERELDTRISLTAEVKNPDFARRVAAPAGACMEDGILLVFGVDTLRGALAGGPLAFFREYDRATRSDRDLPVLSKAIVERLHAASAPAAPGGN